MELLDSGKNVWYQVTCSYACGGVICKNGIVDSTAPIFRWMLGKTEDWLWNLNTGWKYNVVVLKQVNEYQTGLLRDEQEKPS